MNLNRRLQNRRQRQMQVAGGTPRGGRVELIADCADSVVMNSSTRGVGEPRKAMMAVAKVTWEDQDETVHTAPAQIEDTSPSGACFRVKVPIEAGTKVHVSWCRDEFSGTTRWCRVEDGEFVVGMRRDKAASTALARIVPRVQAPMLREVETPPPGGGDIPRVGPVVAPRAREAERLIAAEAVTVPVSEPFAALIQNVPRQRQVIRRGTLRPIPRPVPLPLVRVTFPAAVIREPVIGFEIAFDNSTREATARERSDASAPYQKRTTSYFEERTEMPNKWLNLGAKRQQQDGANGSGNGTPRVGGAAGAAHFSPGMAGDTSLMAPRGDLLLLEDIYRTAGIMEPRLGYSITKVVEMLRSDHLRGLGDEVKRASVLMALNAAGVPLGDILQDAAQRQAAVAAYEVDQRNKFEEYWSRRAEENSQLQAEMERMTRQFIERMNRNLAEVQQEKDAFQMWQHTMQYEVLQISAAVTLCAQPTVFETPTERSAGVGGGHNLVTKSA